MRLSFIILTIVIAFFQLVLCNIELQAQEHTATNSEGQFNRTVWENFVENADYFKEEKESKESKEFSAQKDSKEINLSALKYVFIGLAIALIVFVLLRVFASELFQTSKNKKKRNTFSIDEIDDNLEEAPLYQFLRKAIENRDYKLAIRVYYLIVLQELNEKNLILWHKDKTNNNYVREMSKHYSSNNFKKLTRIFEQVWYGPKDEISEVDYRNIQPAFENYINQLNLKQS